MRDRTRDYWTIEAMLTYGGGFVHALARAAQNADEDNLSRIKSTWPHYWNEYESMGKILESREGKRP